MNQIVQETKETYVGFSNFLQWGFNLFMSKPQYIILAVLGSALLLNKGKAQIGKVAKLG